jgi:hypothetical protein
MLDLPGIGFVSDRELADIRVSFLQSTLMSAGLAPKPKRRRVGLALTSSKS